MTRIRATCPVCGEVDLRPGDIQLEVVADADREVGEGSCYRFSCPSCAELVTKSADARIVRLLTGGGVAAVQCVGDATEPHPEDPPGGPALTLDDLMDLHELLASTDWFHGLESMTRR